MPKLLVADDEDVVRNLVEAVAGGLYIIEKVMNGAEAIRRLEEGGVDVLLTDINMGYGKNGFDVIECANKQERKPYRVMMSGTWSDEQRARAKSLDVDQLMDKPFNVKILEIRLKELAKGFEDKTQVEETKEPEYK